MSYILHIESGNKFEIDGKSAADLQAEIKSVGLIIGNVTLRRMMEGQLESANGFEVIQSLTEEENQETQEALDRANAEKAESSEGGVKEGNGEATPEISVDSTADQPKGEQDAVADAPASDEVVENDSAEQTGEGQEAAAEEGAKTPVDADSAADTAVDADTPNDDNAVVEDAAAATKADEIRRRMLGDNVADAINTVANPKDDAALAAAEATLNKKANDMKPELPKTARKRRHTKREEMVDAAKTSQHGAVLLAVEAGVTPALFLSYVNPDMRWFQFPITETADPQNLHSRKNTYLDLSPISTGGWSFGLYYAGKSATSRVKIKETDAESLVKAINEWLPSALVEVQKAS